MDVTARQRRTPRRMVSILAAIGLASISVAGLATAVQASTSSVAVEIQAEHLTGLRPDGTTVEFRIKVEAEGADASSLVGEGRHFGSAGAHNYWPATGSIDGTVITLGGVVMDSNNPALIGSPVEVEADSSTGTTTLTFGPLAGGPFAGQTIVAEGAGRVSIKTKGV
jgi:hypothetical protein